MCDNHESDNALAARLHAPSRRGLILGGLGLMAGAVALRPTPALAGVVNPLTGQTPIVVAHHVHASGSEHGASWDLQYANAVKAGVDVVVQTDHDHHLLDTTYAQVLKGNWDSLRTGNPIRATSTLAVGAAHVLCEAGSGPASATLKISDRTAWGSLRTLLGGMTCQPTFGARSMADGTSVDITITGSLHPARSGRPAGAYAVRYRFGPGLSPSRSLVDGGLTLLVTAALPSVGSAVTLNPAADMAGAWPDMLTVDNGFQWIAFTANSPRRGAAADVTISSMKIIKDRHDPDSIAAAYGQIRDWCEREYPSITGVLGQEISTGWNPVPHVNTMFAPLVLDPKTGITQTNWANYYGPAMARVPAAGGTATWNHVYGPGTGALTPSQRDTVRQQTLQARLADDFLGATCLEVYTMRGGMPMDQFLRLADTWHRLGRRRLTLVGAHDDHTGTQPWQSLGNGWASGVLAPSRSERDLADAMNGGRAFAFHLRWQGGALLDYNVGGVPMGGRGPGSGSTARVDLSLGALPSGSSVQVVVGQVDGKGTDANTAVATSLGASTFGPSRSGQASVTVDVPSTGAMVRCQVTSSTGQIIGVGQPTFLGGSA